MPDVLSKKIDDLKEIVEISIQQKSADLSDHKKDIIEIKSILEQQDRNQKAFEIKVQPMLSAFERSAETKIVWGRTGVTIKKTAAWVTTVIGAFIALKYGLKYVIQFIKY